MSADPASFNAKPVARLTLHTRHPHVPWPCSPRMKCIDPKLLLAFLTVTITASAFAQDPLRNVITMGSGDMAAIKQKAAGGDAAAQVELGNSLASSFHATEALEWYRKAAVQGNIEAKYRVGRMLLFGALGIPKNLTVQPNQTEGVRWTFTAATNFHPNACWNMSKALRQGLGTSTNLVGAYAWLKLFAETPAGSVVGRMEMNGLALKLDTTALQEAENLAAQFKAGNWQAPVIRIIPEGDHRFRLGGITFGSKGALAVLNGKTFSEGESAKILLKPGTLAIKCLKIEKESVLIAVEGEDEPRILHLK